MRNRAQFNRPIASPSLPVAQRSHPRRSPVRLRLAPPQSTRRSDGIRLVDTDAFRKELELLGVGWACPGGHYPPFTQ
jgi:hypothetical protein